MGYLKTMPSRGDCEESPFDKLYNTFDAQNSPATNSHICLFCFFFKWKTRKRNNCMHWICAALNASNRTGMVAECLRVQCNRFATQKNDPKRNNRSGQRKCTWIGLIVNWNLLVVCGMAALLYSLPRYRCTRRVMRVDCALVRHTIVQNSCCVHK